MSSYMMESYLALGGNEIINLARTKRYIDSGIKPKGFDFRLGGCEGLIDILPCVFSDPVDPLVGYQLPELDPAPWYDPVVPESKNFAGLYVTSITMSSPYSRSVLPNINQGQTLGRLVKQGRTLVVHGFLVGKTCCATQYGLRWLTSAIADQPCGNSGGCGGADLDFLSCCPATSGEDDCLVTIDEDGRTHVYARTPSSTEYQRAEDFFRRMHGVGVVSGPDVISCRGSSCASCGCGALIEVEFVLATSSPYINHLSREVVETTPLPPCEEEECSITWVTNADGGCYDPDCPAGDDSCLDDPLHPLPALPPARSGTASLSVGCYPTQSARVCVSTAPERVWGDSTLNITINAGATAMRNVAIRLWGNPDEEDPDAFFNCEACAILLVSYIPAYGILRLSGEEREVTIECNGFVASAAPYISSVGPGSFGWPDLECSSAALCVEYDCMNTAADASFSVELVDRDL